MDESQSLAIYTARLARLTEADALKLVQAPMLVQTSAEQVELRQGFHTEFIDRRAALNKQSAPIEREVFAVRKRGDSVFGGHISVGRTQNLDVPIARSGVSKFHAFFACDVHGRYQLTDKESKNGTFVGSKRLTPGEAELVPDGIQIRFGGHAFLFMEPASFVRFVQGRQAHG